TDCQLWNRDPRRNACGDLFIEAPASGSAVTETTVFAPRASIEQVEEGRLFAPKFDADGLITCVVTDAWDADVLMVAHMNEEALAKTLTTGEAWVFRRLGKEAVEEGRAFRPQPARRRDAGRLRPGCNPVARRADRRRRLPHRPGELLLPRGAAQAARFPRPHTRIPRRREGVRSG